MYHSKTCVCSGVCRSAHSLSLVWHGIARAKNGPGSRSFTLCEHNRCWKAESSVARLRSKRASADSHAPATSTTEIPLVAILVPARSLAGTTDPSQLALFQHLVPSVLGTLPATISVGVRVAFYVGYDAGDVFYDNEDHKQWIHG